MHLWRASPMCRAGRTTRRWRMSTRRRARRPPTTHRRPPGRAAAAAGQLGRHYLERLRQPLGWAQTFTTPTASLDLRLPGQFTQAEANNLSQNHWRDYDPSIGRYIQADPLGIAAGANLYGYAGDDPYDWIDPDGLKLSLAECLALRAKIAIRSANLLDLINQYNPVTDAFPAWSQRKRGFTNPGGHYQQIQQRQTGLLNDIEQYDRECKDCDGGQAPPLTSEIRDPSYIIVPPPSIIPRFDLPPMEPSQPPVWPWPVVPPPAWVYELW
jgi:RHS repeat-associated protein